MNSIRRKFLLSASALATTSWTGMNCVFADPAPRASTELPPWVPAPGRRVEIPTVNLHKALDPCPQRNCWYSAVGGLGASVQAWVSSVWASDYSNYGATVYWGGGHGAYDGTETYLLNLETLTFERIGPVFPSRPDGSKGGLWFDRDGRFLCPAAYHTYDSMQYRPTALGGGPKGSYLRTPQQYDSSACCQQDLVTGIWTILADPIDSPEGSKHAPSGYSTSVHDSKRNRIWVADPMNYNNRMAWYVQLDASKKQPNWTFEDVGYGIFADLDTTSTYDSKRDLWACLSLRGFANKVRILDLANYRTCGGFVQVKVAGSWPDMSDTMFPNGAPNGASFQYVAQTDCFYTYVGRGSTRIWRLRPPPGDWKTGTWTWTKEEIAGPAPPRSNQNPPYQRFVWVPPLRCFIWHDDVTLRPQAWRPLAL